VTVLFGWFRRRRELVLENAASRQQLAMHERRPPDIQDSERMFWVWLVRIWPGGRGVVIAVRPEMGRVMASGRLATLLDVEEQVEASWPAEHRPEARALIMRLARENRCWGAVRTQGELRALGHEVSPETVRRYRLRPRRRPPSQSWRTSLRW
jgi:hypothetical protein